MIIAVDDSLLDYALKWALASNDGEEVNYICNRIGEAVPGMQLKHVVWCQQRIVDWVANNEYDYFKSSALKRLSELLATKRKEFVE